MLEFPPDITALYQALLFVALWAILKRVALDRFVETLAARRSKTEGALAEARKLGEEAVRLRSEYDSAMAEIKRQAVQEKEEIRRQAEKEERELVNEARGEAQRVLDALRLRVAGEVSIARAALAGETGELSERVAQALLGRPS